MLPSLSNVICPNSYRALANRLRSASKALMGTISGSKFCQLLEEAAIELEMVKDTQSEKAAKTPDDESEQLLLLSLDGIAAHLRREGLPDSARSLLQRAIQNQRKISQFQSSQKFHDKKVFF